jgi:hypothetical protein
MSVITSSQPLVPFPLLLEAIEEPASDFDDISKCFDDIQRNALRRKFRYNSMRKRLQFVEGDGVACGKGVVRMAGWTAGVCGLFQPDGELCLLRFILGIGAGQIEKVHYSIDSIDVVVP